MQEATCLVAQVDSTLVREVGWPLASIHQVYPEKTMSQPRRMLGDCLNSGGQPWRAHWGLYTHPGHIVGYLSLYPCSELSVLD